MYLIKPVISCAVLQLWYLYFQQDKCLSENCKKCYFWIKHLHRYWRQHNVQRKPALKFLTLVPNRTRERESELIDNRDKLKFSQVVMETLTGSPGRPLGPMSPSSPWKPHTHRSNRSKMERRWWSGETEPLESDRFFSYEFIPSLRLLLEFPMVPLVRSRPEVSQWRKSFSSFSLKFSSPIRHSRTKRLFVMWHRNRVAVDSPCVLCLQANQEDRRSHGRPERHMHVFKFQATYSALKSQLLFFMNWHLNNTII